MRWFSIFDVVPSPKFKSKYTASELEIFVKLAMDGTQLELKLN